MTAEASQIELELRQLLDRLGPEQSRALLNYLGQIKSPALKLSTTNPNLNHTGMQGLASGEPLLPRDFVWPQDRAGVAMRFLLQLDFARLTRTTAITESKADGKVQAIAYGCQDLRLPTTGVLTIFYSDLIFTAPTKDGRSFCINYLQQTSFDLLQGNKIGQTDSDCTQLFARAVWTLPPELGDIAKLSLDSAILADLKVWAQKVNFISSGNFGRLLGCEPVNIAQDKEICAFASGGISYSQARAKDRHYSHLIDQASNWILLAELIGTKSGPDQNQNLQHPPARILINRDDLKERLFERAWLLFNK